MTSGAPTEVACGLLLRDGKLLLARRPMHKFFGGLWEFPGGKREAEESIEQCLIRELREELGILIEVTETLRSHEVELDGQPFIFTPMLCTAAEGEPEPLEHMALAWVPLGEVELYQLIDVDRAIFAEALSLLTGTAQLDLFQGREVL